ncbi:MAG: TDT family transporter [Bacilli bacterium]
MKNIPIAYSGIALGVMGLANTWGMVGHSFFRHIAVLLAATVLIVHAVRFIRFPAHVFKEMQDSYLGAFYSTYSMLFILVAGYTGSKTLYLVGIVLHLLISWTFMRAAWKNRKTIDIVPAYFVPPVGICIAAVAGTQVGLQQFSQLVFWYGFLFFILVFPFIVRRIPHVPESKHPAIIIVAAPASLCLAGYLTAFPNPNIWIVGFLGTVAVCCTLYAYYRLPALLARPFFPGLAPLTFPLAIGSLAMRKLTDFLLSVAPQLAIVTEQLFYIELVIATSIIMYIAYSAIRLEVLRYMELKEQIA